MIEGLWSVRFASNLEGENIGGGIVVFETDRVFGGDSQYYYLGRYNVSNGTVTCELTITHYFGPGESVFGPRETFTLSLEGELKEGKFVLLGHVVEDPNMTIFIALEKRAELP